MKTLRSDFIELEDEEDEEEEEEEEVGEMGKGFGAGM
jgi:hypothetical protein